MNVEGVIQDTGGAGSLVDTGTYNHQSFMEKLDAIEEDSTVRGIVLRVNSPGGGVVESAEIYDKLVEITQKRKKPCMFQWVQWPLPGLLHIRTCHKNICQ